jgi:tetratricopeptide (TPR) repeat protein
MNRGCVFLSLLVVLVARGEIVPDQLTRAGISEFTAGFQAWDGARFAAAADLFRQATTNNSATVTNFYWLGVAHFHRMLHLQNSAGATTNQAQASAALEAALAALTAALKRDDRHAESHALLGTLYGMKIGGSVLRAVRFGPRVQHHRHRALATGAENPRVMYLLGVCEFHTAGKPAAWRKALASLLEADKLFEAEQNRANSPLEPRWGRSSCLTFLGRTYEQLDRPKDAADYFRKALAMHPADHLARNGLERVGARK